MVFENACWENIDFGYIPKQKLELLKTSISFLKLGVQFCNTIVSRNARLCQFPYFPNIIRRGNMDKYEKYAILDSDPIGHLPNIYTISRSAKPVC